MGVAVEELLEIGLYTPREAALYARVPMRTLVRWFFGNRQGGPVLRPQRDGAEEKSLSFLDFVQALAIRAVRLQHRVPLQRIREGIENAQQRYGVAYPLAMRHTIYLFNKNLIIRQPGDEEDLYTQLSGKRAPNLLLPKVVELYMTDLTFGEEGLAAAYRAFAWKNLEICMDPRRRFGEPLVTSCGYSAQALWEAFKAERSFEAAAWVCEVTQEEVEIACRFYDHLLTLSDQEKMAA